MAQRIAVLVALVCFSGSSLSRSWVGFDDNDDPESWQVEPVDYGPNRRSRYYSGEDSWESDEDYDYLGPENGYDQDKFISSNNGYHKDLSSHANDYHDRHQVGQHHDHGYNDNWGPHGHGFPGHPDYYWRSIGHHSHSTSDQHNQNWRSQGHHGQTEYTGQPGENWASHGHPNQNGSPGQLGRNWGPHGDNTQSVNHDQPGQNTGPSRGLPQNNVNRPQVSGNDADRIVFPDFNNHVSTTRSPPTNRPSTTTAWTTTTDRTLTDMVICIRTCPTTSEYNPVCGTNKVTYNNPGALQCARNCGLNVALARQAPCPRAVPPPTTTARPITNPTTRPTLKSTEGTTTMRTTFPTVNPTHFTNINVNVVNRPGATPIPLDILQSVFGTASPTNTSNNTEEPEFQIDRRRKP